jgi:hypothetical protein
MDPKRIASQKVEEARSNAMSVTDENEIDKTHIHDAASGKSEKPDMPERKVTVTVDDDPVQTVKNTTPGKLLIVAGLDPAKRQLVKVEGKHQIRYPDPDAKLEVHDGEQFITVSTGGTPVS